jgi:hypothetical protein
MYALRHKRSIRNGRLGEVKGQDSFETMVFGEIWPTGLTSTVLARRRPSSGAESIPARAPARDRTRQLFESKLRRWAGSPRSAESRFWRTCQRTPCLGRAVCRGDHARMTDLKQRQRRRQHSVCSSLVLRHLWIEFSFPGSVAEDETAKRNRSPSHNAMAGNSDSDLIMQTRLQNRRRPTRRCGGRSPRTSRFHRSGWLAMLATRLSAMAFLGDREGGSRLAGASRWR